MPAYVIVDVSKRGATATRSAREALTGGAARRLLAEHKGVLLPESAPGDPTTATIAVPDMNHAHALASALRDLQDIETAYAKPGEELP